MPFSPFSVNQDSSIADQYVAAFTGPTIALTRHLFDAAFNAFGGFIRWVAAPGAEIWATAGAAPNGEICLDSVSGTGVVSTTMVFEEIY